MLACITSAELTEWIAFYRFEPFGPAQDALNAGVIASTVANVHRRRGSKLISPDDLMIKGPAELEKEPETPAEMSERIKRSLLSPRAGKGKKGRKRGN